MRKHAKWLSVIVILGLVLFVRVEPAKALFGIPGLPEIVWDPTSVAEVAKDVAAVIQLTNLATRIQGNIQNAQRFFSGGYKYAWRGIITSTALQMQTANHWGTTTGWYNATAGPIGGFPAWSTATLPLSPGAFLSNDARARADVASVDVADAAGVNALTTIGTNSSDRIQMDGALKKYESTVMDGSDGSNSEVQQLNLLTSGTTLGLHYQQLQGNQLGALLELQTAQAKVQRDQIASHVQFETDAQTYAATEGYGMGSCVSCTIHPVVP
jgi:type IV secretion system protein TrbJ